MRNKCTYPLFLLFSYPCFRGQPATEPFSLGEANGIPHPPGVDCDPRLAHRDSLCSSPQIVSASRAVAIEASPACKPYVSDSRDCCVFTDQYPLKLGLTVRRHLWAIHLRSWVSDPLSNSQTQPPCVSVVASIHGIVSGVSDHNYRSPGSTLDFHRRGSLVRGRCFVEQERVRVIQPPAGKIRGLPLIHSLCIFPEVDMLRYIKSMSRGNTVLCLIAIGSAGLAVLAYFAYASRGSDIAKIEQLLGDPPPSASHVLNYSDRAGMFGGDYYFTLSISHKDYVAYTSLIGLVHEPDLLDMWPTALSRRMGPSWWLIGSANNEHTLYLHNEAESSLTVTQFDRNMMYCRVSIY